MYLLGRGELYLTLIDHLHTTMKGPPTTVMSYGKSAFIMWVLLPLFVTALLCTGWIGSDLL